MSLKTQIIGSIFIYTLTCPGIAAAESTLRIGMTLSDIPLPNGQTEQGGEGMRFIGYTMFDALVAWDLSSADKPSLLIPGLAIEWKVDEEDPTIWTFKLREGVTFHDGSAFTAESVVWNFDKILNEASPQYDPRQSSQGRQRMPSVKSYRAIDPMTLEVVTKEPDALLLYGLSWVVMSSPAQWENVGRSWDKFIQDPSGTGPWKMDKYIPRQRAELVRNAAYWDRDRIPKSDRLVLLPIPDANSRVAALRSGQVDWIEAPPPDAIPALSDSGFQIVTNDYPHNWTWHLSLIDGSPWQDIKIRKAANLGVDREGLKQLLGGLMTPAKGFMPPSSTWFGTPEFEVKYDPQAAMALMQEAAYSKEKPLSVKVMIAPSGGGQMQPLLMNEFIQQNLAEIGIAVEFEIVDWNALITAWRAGAKDQNARGVDAVNLSYTIQEPFGGLVRFVDSKLVSPNGTNWGYYADAEMDKLLEQLRTTFDKEEQDALLRQIHKKYVDEALFLFVAHDVSPRAMSPKVKGFVQAKNWFQDFGRVTVE